MTPIFIWSVFVLILVSIFVLIDTSLPTYKRGNKIEDRVVQQAKNLVYLKVNNKSQDKITRVDSKKIENPTLFGNTNPLVFQTPSLHPSPYALTSEQPPTSLYSSLEHKKHGWKKYLVHLMKCDDTPTQPLLSSKPSSMPTNQPTLESNFPSISKFLSSLPSTTPNPSSTFSNHTLKWKISADDIDRVFENKDRVAQSLQKSLDHRLRCKSEGKIKHVKLIQDQEEKELYVKAVCLGSRKRCTINLSGDDCNDNSLIDDFVAKRMLDISSSFDYEIDLSVSFDFDKDNIDVVPDFLSELIEGDSETQRAMSNSGRIPPPQLNNEAALSINKDATNSNFQNKAIFHQNEIEVEEVIFLSAEDFSITELASSDDAPTDSSYYDTPKRKRGSKYAEEKFTVEKIFAFYDVNFNTSIDVCFWDDINCIDGSVTQIFMRKY